MKKSLLSLMSILGLMSLVYLSCSEKKKNNQNVIYEHETIATFNGLYQNKFKFSDEDGNTIIFNDIENDLAIDLYDEESVGMEYIVYWEEELQYRKDDNGRLTGDTVEIKKIVHIDDVDQ